jgi:long-chain acyl-CoA synthetase
MRETLLEQVADRVQRSPEATALVTPKEGITTYAGLWSQAREAAGALMASGIRRQDRVLLAAGRANASFPVCYLATHLLRAVAVPIDPRMPAARVRWIADQVDAKLILVEDAERLDSRQLTFKELLAAASTLANLAFPQPDELADVLFTTGSTGEPKGVRLSHRAILAAAHNINLFIGNRDDDVEVVPLPLSHSFGLGRMRCNLLAGGGLVLVGGFSFPGVLFKAIEENAATGFASAPAGLEILLKAGGDRLGRYARQLRYVEIGSAPMAESSRRRLMRLLPATRICMHYGLTEASRCAFIEFHADSDHLSSIGRPSPNVELAIWDDEGNEAAAGVTGRIMVKGAMVSEGYWGNAAATEAAFFGEWLYTGDYGHRDGDGYFYLDAREKELINVGGRKVSPNEVEAEIQKFEAVDACACIGVPDPAGITGETVWACLVSSRDIDEAALVDALRQSLEPHKIPTHFLYVERIPKTESGKIRRLELKRRIVEALASPR